jgi:mRNA interferase RelE/StbE
MTWDIQVLPRAEKALKKLDKPQARRIRDALVRLAGLDDPASACKALGGPLTGLWRYRVGDYRVIPSTSENPKSSSSQSTSATGPKSINERISPTQAQRPHARL